MVLRVGLTGGIAGGKSTVGRLLAERGYLVADADSLVAELYRPGEPGATEVERLFGAELLTAEGAVDHQKLSARVFPDTRERQRLERAIHPLVGQRFADLVAAATQPVIFEATLLVDTGGYRNFDLLVTVEAGPELRVRRAVDRGLTEDEARARLNAQATTEQRIEAADFVVENEGSLSDLEAEVERLDQFLQQARKKQAQEQQDRE